jgi:hypothetical protein
LSSSCHLERAEGLGATTGAGGVEVPEVGSSISMTSQWVREPSAGWLTPVVHVDISPESKGLNKQGLVDIVEKYVKVGV